MSHFKTEAGYTLLAYIIVIFLLTISAFGLVGKDFLFDTKAAIYQKHVNELEKIKDRLKTFSLLTPYLYISSTDSGSGYKDIEEVPGVGYFPCPDFDGDGDSETSCGNPSPALYKNRSVTLSSLATSPIPNVGFLPQFIKSRLFQVSSNHQFKTLYLLDTKFAVNNECFSNFFPVNVYMDARNYADASQATLSGTITPAPLCSDVSTIVDSEGRGVSLNLDYIKTVSSSDADPNQSVADDFLNNKNLRINTLLACDPAVCLDDDGNQNPYLAPSKSFFDPNLMPKIKINNRPFYVFALISPGLNGTFETIVEPGSYKKGGINVDDGTVEITQQGDDVVVGLHFLEWAKMMQENICSSRAWFSDIVRNYLYETDPTQLNKLWLFRHDENLGEGYTNKSGANWSDQVFPDAFNPSNLPEFSICELNIIEQ